jgi:hypothetical protein
MVAPRARFVFGHYCLPLELLAKAARKQNLGQQVSKISNPHIYSYEGVLLLEARVFSSADKIRFRIQTTTLFQLAASEGYRDSSRDEDRIYALIGLVIDWFDQPPMVPDYSRPVVDLYVQATIDEILGTKNLWPLTLCRTSGSYGKLLPSWVMDWTAFRLGLGETRQGNDYFGLSTRLYKASKKWEQDIEIFERKYLKTHAVSVGVIDHISDNVGFEMCSHADKIRDRILRWKRACLSNRLSSTYFTGQASQEVLIRTVSGDIMFLDEGMSCRGIDLYFRQGAAAFKRLRVNWDDDKGIHEFGNS